jgi:RING finger/CHY zinc finger protein 1
MCRRGKREEHRHCTNCGYCIHISAFGEHICREKKVESDCPVCLENLKYSTKYWIPMECGHLIHRDCFKLYCKTSVNCPVCGLSFVKMNE